MSVGARRINVLNDELTIAYNRIKELSEAVSTKQPACSNRVRQSKQARCKSNYSFPYDSAWNDA